MIVTTPGEIFGKVLDILKNFQKDFPKETQNKVRILINNYLDTDVINSMEIDMRDDFRKLRETLTAFRDAKIHDPIRAETFYDTNVAVPFARSLTKRHYLPALQANAKRTIDAFNDRKLARQVRAI